MTAIHFHLAASGPSRGPDAVVECPWRATGHGIPQAGGELSLQELVAYMPPGMRSASTVRRMVREGVLPAHRPRGRYYFILAEVRGALDALDRRRAAVQAFRSTGPVTPTVPQTLLDLLAPKKRRSPRGRRGWLAA